MGNAYTKSQIKAAGWLAEVPAVEVENIIKYLDQASKILQNPFDCRNCKELLVDDFGERTCRKRFAFPMINCEGVFFLRKY